MNIFASMKLKLDLHSVFNQSARIDEALEIIVNEAIEKKAASVEIITGKGSGQLKKRVLKYLERRKKELPSHRIYKDRDNFGRIFIRFQF